MVDAATRGWRDNSGIFSKQTVEERILPVLNSKLGCHKTYNNYQSRLKWFKNRWASYSTLMRFSSGFGFDSTTKRFTASDEVWEDYLKAHPNDTNLRYGIFQDYEDLEIAIGNGVAVGKNSMGLGGATDARTLGVEEDRDIRIEDFDYDVDSDVFVRPNQNDRSFRSTSPLGSPEILEIPKQGRTQTKRNRTEYEGNTPQHYNTNGNFRPRKMVGNRAFSSEIPFSDNSRRRKSRRKCLGRKYVSSDQPSEFLGHFRRK
ncbi:hypothetical protein ABKV19_011738 [Rosa sericea]